MSTADIPTVEITGDTIRLGQFLKLAGLAESGAQARELIQSGDVSVDGEVLDPPEDADGTKAIAELNARIQADGRVEIAMLAIADGITLALKR